MQVFDRKLRLTDLNISILAQSHGEIDLQFNDFKGDRGRMYFSVSFMDLADALNFHRLLGQAIGELQPGLVDPLPEGDPSEVDAMKVLYEADSRMREVL